MHDPAQLSENRDLLAYLRKSGFADLLDAVPSCMASGELSAAAVARHLGIRRSRATQMIQFARSTLQLQTEATTLTAARSMLCLPTPLATTARSASACN